MTPEENTPPPDTPRIDPKDMATYMLVTEKRIAATMEELAVAHRVAEALKHPAVREEWKTVLQMEDPIIHPKRYPSAN